VSVLLLDAVFFKLVLCFITETSTIQFEWTVVIFYCVKISL